MFLSVCFVATTTSAFSQVKAVTKAEYDELDKFRDVIYKTSRIVTTVTKEYQSKKHVETSKFIQEYESENRNRWTYYETKDGVTKKTLEIIYYDGKEYRPESDGEWKEIDRVGLAIPTIKGNQLPKMEQFAIGKTTMKEKPVRLFSFYRVYSYGRVLSFFDELIWVDEGGKILLKRSIRSLMFPNNVEAVTETKYEYNPKNLKIEVPKTPKVQK